MYQNTTPDGPSYRIHEYTRNIIHMCVHYLHTNIVARHFNQLTRLSFLFFSNNWIAKFPTDEPLELARSIFQVQYHLKIIRIPVKNYLQIVILNLKSTILSHKLLYIAHLIRTSNRCMKIRISGNPDHENCIKIKVGIRSLITWFFPSVPMLLDLSPRDTTLLHKNRISFYSVHCQNRFPLNDFNILPFEFS